jgi:hypothetical protein
MFVYGALGYPDYLTEDIGFTLVFLALSDCQQGHPFSGSGFYYLSFGKCAFA